MGFANGAGYMVAAFSAKIFVAASDGGKDYSRSWIVTGACVVLGIIAASFIPTREKPVVSSVETSRA
jgi:cyanate permease